MGGRPRALLVGVLFGLGQTGCSTVYRPLAGLNRPVVVDIETENFKGVTLRLQCLPGDVVDEAEARTLCTKLQHLFENQGAKVTVSTSLSEAEPDELGDDDELGDEETAGSPAPNKKAGNRPQLTLRLASHLIHEDVSSYLFFDVRTGYSFAQEVTLTDETGFLLVRERLTAQFEDRFMGSRNGEEFSQDFYRQLSQLAVNAHVRRQVLVESAINRSK